MKLIDPERFKGGLIPLGNCLFIIKVQSIGRILRELFQGIGNGFLRRLTAFFLIIAGFRISIQIEIVIPSLCPLSFLHTHGNPEAFGHSASKLHSGTVLIKSRETAA